MIRTAINKLPLVAALLGLTVPLFVLPAYAADDAEPSAFRPYKTFFDAKSAVHFGSGSNGIISGHIWINAKS